MRQLEHTIFITNNHSPFHLWWKENLVKYYIHDCLLKSHFRCSPVIFLHIFRTPFPKNTSGGLSLYPATSLRERTPTQVIPDEFCEVLKTTFLRNTSRQLLLFYGKIFIGSVWLNRLGPARETEEEHDKDSQIGISCNIWTDDVWDLDR